MRQIDLTILPRNLRRTRLMPGPTGDLINPVGGEPASAEALDALELLASQNFTLAPHERLTPTEERVLQLLIDPKEAARSFGRFLTRTELINMLENG